MKIFKNQTAGIALGLIASPFFLMNAQVGLNTSNPSATLDVVSKGNTSATKALEINNSTGTELVTVRDNGQVGINQASPATDALLELNSSSKALLLTRVITADNISSPENGMMVYDITMKCVRGFENNSWSGCLSAIGGGTTDNPVFGRTGSCGNVFNDIKSFGHSSFTNRPFYTNNRYADYFISAAGKFYTNTGYFIDEDYYPEAVSTMTDRYSNPYSSTVPVNKINSLYPDTIWKDFSDTNIDESRIGSVVTLISEDGKIVVFNSMRNVGTSSSDQFTMIMGPNAVNTAVVNQTQMNSNATAFPLYEIKAYSAVGTQVPSNWGWFTTFEQYNNPDGRYALNIAYNKTDGLFYTWGGLSTWNGSFFAQTATPTNVKTLLRNAAGTLTDNMTPLPATILNGVLSSLGTTIKEYTHKYPTVAGYYYTNANGVPGTGNVYYHFVFITADGRFVALNPHTGFYFLESLPNGAKAVSLFADYGENAMVLGDDGKVYKVDIYNKIAASAGDTSLAFTVANTNAGTNALSFKQIARTDSGYFFGVVDSGEIYVVRHGTYAGTDISATAPTNLTTLQSLPLVDFIYTYGYGNANYVPTNAITASSFSSANIIVNLKDNVSTAVLYPVQSQTTVKPLSGTTTNYLGIDGIFYRYNQPFSPSKPAVMYRCDTF
ncbi:hypothetical protein [Chryseobacterium gambrini]|uniref:Uncharacterized protein n=1 Tax=Chryseobacterium gambrini TaxID=373672 RepID=A0ABM8K7S4_9FLAO|nr:hypothetical protein CRDW_11330 [Chryseobacterium gambrini]